MRVEQLKLEHYRNLEQVFLTPAPGINILVGDNAQGKTNLMEAVWRFTGAKSFRGSRESEEIQFGQERARLLLLFSGEGRQQEAEIVLGKGKKTLLNEIPLSSNQKLSGVFCAVVFSPEHLSLVKDGPEFRRKLLDTAICQMVPKYHAILHDYYRILGQRNALLKKNGSFFMKDMLDVWDVQLSRRASVIIKTRIRYLHRLEQAAKEIYRGIAGGNEELSLHYLCSVDAYEETMEDSVGAEVILRQLEERREEDLTMRATLSGPHRDEFLIAINGLAAKKFGSQGQQRSCVLSLKLAECQILEEILGETPVILLDDVMSELDENRRDYLLNHIGGRQVFITGCDSRYFQNLAGGKIFFLKQGQIVREEEIGSVSASGE